VYTAPVNISQTRTLKAIAYKAGMTTSTVTTGVYTISGGTGPTTITLNPSDDRNTQSDNAAGTGAVIACSQWNTIYIKFNASSVSGPITSAKIRIYKVPASAVTLEAYQVTNDGWTQATAPASLPAKGSLIASVASGATAGYVEIDITSFVSGQISGDKVISIALNTNIGTWTDFQTREGANQPQLVIVKP
jgi:hypothetical protein